jgi:hypothetical protein
MSFLKDYLESDSFKNFISLLKGKNKMEKYFKYGLGWKVRDIVTGYSGIITSRSQWLTGCNTYGILQQELKDFKPVEAQWFDETRLEIINDNNVLEFKEKEIKKEPGGPQDTPQQTNKV